MQFRERGCLLHYFAPIGSEDGRTALILTRGTEAHADVRDGRETTGAAVMA
jgi:hypothetical protein